ncbi:MAG: hypothetical protein K2R98_14140 [Gemmataceae bacterium]|nr:hypothetical protein [Gemmataceae bacterium]
MAWIVGIDEAGYGPNLGPFVMTAVAGRVPDALVGGDLWKVLADGVRRQAGRADSRLVVDDSKAVYSTAQGLAALETSVLAILMPHLGTECTLGSVVEAISPAARAELCGECWYTGQTSLPVEADAAVCSSLATEFQKACGQVEVAWRHVRSAVVVPTRFNACVEQWGSKGAVLGQALGELVRGIPDDDGEPIAFFIDKHGGRNFYTAMLQDAVLDGMVVAREEGRERSVYDLLGGGRSMRWTFQPRADGEHFCVALASMVSKYLRELLMLEFNRFWRTHVPDLKPTAGYPGDAARFHAAIRPTAQRLGIAEHALWRNK